MITQDSHSTSHHYGCDEAADVSFHDNVVRRKIVGGPAIEETYHRVFDLCQKNDLFKQLGIVSTKKITTNDGLLFEHERLPFVSYPYEWASEMFLEAARFHLRLILGLQPFGLTLKDWHPYNILFKSTEPIFVDFTSIIPIEDLPTQDYLQIYPTLPRPLRFLGDAQSCYWYEMHEQMFLPYFLFPILLGHQGRFDLARKRLSETVLNIHRGTIQLDEVLSQMNPKGQQRYRWKKAFKTALLFLQRGKSKRAFHRFLEKELRRFMPSPPSTSGYVDYYQRKSHGMETHRSQWTAKQQCVAKLIEKTHQATPLKTVLDLGCNTGWYSKLAARLTQASVVAIDGEEDCISELYRAAKNEKLSLLPLVLNLDRLPPDQSGYASDHSPKVPLHPSPQRRLQSDLVLSLALVHHLILGLGWSLKKTIHLLSQFTSHALVVEFVEKKDALIQADLNFFNALNQNPHQFAWYSLDAFEAELKAHFSYVQRYASDSPSRHLFYCTRS